MGIEWRAKDDPDFLSLIVELDAYARDITGPRHAAFAPHNALQHISDVALLVLEGQAVGCGALKPHEDGTVELKRVYVKPASRRLGCAQTLLDALETQARAQGFHTLLLETNPEFAPAVALYKRNGFTEVEAFSPYQGMNTLCMGKRLIP
jgi:ribosomal protein S18 acetylase RimI-like enzyme